MLAECKASVEAQTFRDHSHLVVADDRCYGEATMRNSLLRLAHTEWVAFLDDDDLFLPHHLETLWNAREGADVVYSDCRVEGLQKHWTVREFDLDEIRKKNYVSVTVLARRESLLKVGGFRRVPNPDWDLWIRLGGAGAKFKFVDEVTWVYRVHPGSIIMNQ
jgi:glycosyltransferase involved in cell wall biosynthesis